MYRVNVDLPNLPHGALVEVDGVGIFNNGESTDLPEDFNEEAFIAHHAPNNVMQDPATLEATWGESAPDFNLLNAFDLTPGVAIEEYEPESEPSSDVVDSASQEASPETPDTPDTPEPSKYDGLSLKDLRTEIDERNKDREEKLSVSGTKEELVERLKEDDK